MNAEHQGQTLENSNPKEKKPKWQLKGVWIPSMVFFDSELTDSEIRLFGIINILDGETGCFATNTYLSEIMDCTERSITNGIAKLLKQGYIGRTNNQRRTLVVLPKANKHRKSVLPRGRKSVLPGVENPFYHNNKSYKQEYRKDSKESYCDSKKRITGTEGDLVSNDNLDEQNNVIDNSIDPPQSATLRKQSKLYKPTKKELVLEKHLIKIKPLMDFWELKVGRKFRGITPTYIRSCESILAMLNGKYLNENNSPSLDPKYYGMKMTIEEIKSQFIMFGIMRNNVDYHPKNKKPLKNITPETFFYNQDAPKMKSYFIHCLENKLKPTAKQFELKDPNPDYTNYVIVACKRVFGWDLGNGDRATAIKCADRLSKFFADNRHRIMMYGIHYKFTNQQVDELLTMLEKNESPEYPVKPTYLYGNLTYDKLLPEHLDRVGSLMH